MRISIRPSLVTYSVFTEHEKVSIPVLSPITEINASIYLFSSILESVHRQKLKEVINSSINVLCEFFKL